MQFYDKLRLYPFIRFFIPFITGIIIGFSFHPDYYAALSVMVSLTTATVLVHILNKNYHLRWVYGLLVNLLFLLTGIIIINTHNAGLEKEERLAGRKLTFRAVVSDEISIKEKSVGTVLKITSLYNDTVNTVHARITARFSKSDRAERLQPGDILIIKTELKEIDDPKNPFEFNYKRWMRGRGIVLTTFVRTESWKIAGRKKGPEFIISKLRKKITLIYEESGISGDELAILSALTLGDKANLSDEISGNFAMAGAMHVLAVSGLHVGIIFLFINYLLFFTSRFKSGKIIRLIIVIIILWIFAILTGLRPSATRAAFMFSVIQTGKTLRKPPEIQNTIFFSAFFILLINPLQVTDIGFQLSYLAITGIVFFQPRIYRLIFIPNWLIDKIWQLFTVSLSAQLVTATLTIYYFHYFPVYFWLSNLIVIILVGIIISLAIFQMMLYVMHFPLLLTGKALNFILKILSDVTSGICHLPGSLIEHINVSTYCMLLLYSIIILVTIWLLNRNKFFLILSILMILIFISNGVTETIVIEKQKRMIVFSVKNKSLTGLIAGRRMLIISDRHEPSNIADSYEMKNYLIKRGIRKTEWFDRYEDASACKAFMCFCPEKADGNIFFKSGQFRGLILRSPDILAKDADEPLKLNCIILSHNVKADMKRLAELFEFRYLILDSSNDFEYRATWLNKAIPDNYTLYSVADSEAIEIETD